MDDATTARLAALRVEYAAARRAFERELDAGKASRDRLHEMAGEVQRLYLAVYLLEHNLTEDDA